MNQTTIIKLLLFCSLINLLLFFRIDTFCNITTTDIDNKLIHPIFNLMNNILVLINNCVMGYFIVFQNLFHYSLHIIFNSVLHYFYIFNHLFMYSLDILRFIVHDYFNLVRFILHYLFIWPNSILTFLTINCILYLKFK